MPKLTPGEPWELDEDKEEVEEWWKRKEPEQPPQPGPEPWEPTPQPEPAPGPVSQPRQPMPVPIMPGPQMPGLAPQTPVAPAPATWLPGVQGGAQPTALYQHGGEEPKTPWDQYVTRVQPPMPEPEPEPVYARPGATPTPSPLIGLMSERVAPQLQREPEAILRDVIESDEYGRSVGELYREVSELTPPEEGWAPGLRGWWQRLRTRVLQQPAPTPYDIAHQMLREEGEERTVLPPIDPQAPLEVLRDDLQQARLTELGDNLMTTLARWHEQRAALDREKGQYALAVRHEQLAAAARGDVGRTSVGYLGEWLEQPGYIARSAFARYVQPMGNRFAEATPEELDEGARVLHEAARAQEERERGLSAKNILQHLGGMVEAGVAPRRAEARWNPNGLPVPRYPGEVREFLIARHGDTPEVQNAAAWAEAMSFSGAERMLAGAERILAGEDPYAVLFGHTVNLANPTTRDLQVYIEFLEATERRGQDVEAARQYVQDFGYLPGEAHAYRELGGAIGFDPTQLISYGDLVGLIGVKASTRKAVRTWTEAVDTSMDLTKMDPEAVKNFGRVMSAGYGVPLETIEQLANLPPGTVRAAERGAVLTDAARLANAPNAQQPVHLLQKTWHELTNPLELTPEANASLMREPATMLATTLAPVVRSKNDAKALIESLAEHPGRLADMNLLPPMVANSQAVAELQPVFRALAGQMDGWSSMKAKQFSLADWTDDLTRYIREASDELAGVVDRPAPDVLFANSVRNFMHDFWMPGTPGYTVRNMSGDISIMTHDGIMTLDRWEDVQGFLDRIPTKTARTLGLVDAGPLAGMTGGLAEAPYIGGTVKQLRRMIQTGEIPFHESKLAKAVGLDRVLPKDTTILGEENRYGRGLYTAYQRANALWWRGYGVPDVLTETLGPGEARRLWGLMAEQLSDEESQAAIGEFLSGKRMRFAVQGYMDDLSDLPPAMQAELNQQLTKALAIEDPAESLTQAIRVMDDMLDDVRKTTDQMIGVGATPPGRKVVSPQSVQQDVDEFGLAVGEMGRYMGVPNDEAVAGAKELERVIRDAESAATDAELAALRLSRERQLPPDAARALILDTRATIEEQRLATRAAVDQLRDQAWDDYLADRPRGGEIWRRFRADAGTGWEELQGLSRNKLQQIEEQVGKLAEGEPISDIIPDYGQVMRHVSDYYLQLHEQLAEQDEALKLTQGPRLTEFYKSLNLHRQAEDAAADMAWRMALQNPSQDAIDILYSAQQDITELARTARGKHDLALVKLHSGMIDYPTYLDEVQAAWWQGYWDQSPHRYMQAGFEIADANGLGEALSTGVLRDVARKVGVDITDLANVGKEGWQKIRDTAADLVTATSNKVQQAEQQVQGQLASQVVDMVYPRTVEDYAYQNGFDDLSKMTADEWQRVANSADMELQRWRGISSEVGRQERVAAISGRQPVARGGQGALADQPITEGALSRKEERELLQQFTREARDKESEFVSWLLHEAGYNDRDLLGLNLQQRERLLEELGQGSLLVTQPRGPIRGSQQLLDDADWLLKQAGYTDADLGAMTLEQKLDDLSELAIGQPTNTPQFEEAILPEGYRGGAQTLVGSVTAAETPGNVSRIGGLAPERRQAVLDSMPFEVRQMAHDNYVGGAKDPLDAVVYQWERIQAQAKEWADLVGAGVPYEKPLEAGVYSGKGYPVFGAYAAAPSELPEPMQRLAELRDEYEKVRRFAEQRFDAWSRVDFDDEGRLASTNWMATNGQQVATIDRMNARNHMASGPRPADAALAAENQQALALRKLRDALQDGVWDDALDARATKLSEAQIDTIRKWYKEEFRPLNNARSLVVMDAARDMADFALLDYNKRRNFDTLLAQWIPYHYWYTRSARNWAMRFAARPQIAKQYLTYKKWMRRANEGREYPSRLEGMLEVPAGFLPDWTGQRMYIDPMRYVWPFESLMNPYANTEPDEETELTMFDYLYRGGKKLGMEPFPHLKVALILAGGLALDPEELYNFLPQTAPIQGVTAGLRELGVQQVPPGGFYIEGWVRRALGLNDREPADLYRIARSEVSAHLDALAAGDPANVRTALMAMELVYAVERKELRLGEAMGLVQGYGRIREPQMPGTEVTEKLRLMAEQNRWTPEELNAAQMLLGQAVQRAALERATAGVGGFLGMPVYMYPTGEQRARELQTQARAQRWSEVTGLGSREQYMAWAEAHPEAYMRPLTFGLLPGAEQGAYTPQQRLNLLDYNTQRELVEQSYQQDRDNLIRERPFDSAGVSALRQEEAAVLDGLRKTIMGEEYDAEALWSVYGATPEERKKRRREQVLSIIAYNEPDLADYTDPQTGEPDYDAWEQAKDDYYELGVKAILESDPAIQQILLEQPIQEFLIETLPFTGEARRWFEKMDFPVLTGEETGGGAGWAPGLGEHGTIGLGYPQYEAALHEFTHAWWHEARQNNPKMRDEFVKAVLEYAETPMPWDEYAETWQLLQGYVNGTPGWEQGMRAEDLKTYPTGWNDAEMFAGLASGTMGDMGKLPPELRKFYEHLFTGEPVEIQPLGQMWDVIDRLEGAVGRVTRDDITAYRRRNDSELEAAQHTYNELYSLGWEAYTKAVEQGMDKSVAYRTYIEALPAMTAGALIPAIQERYPDRWSDEELRQALAGVQFPSGDETHVLRMPQAEQEVSRARDEFYDYIRWHVPPGDFEYDMRDAIPLLNAIRDFSTREALDESGFTAEQYREALRMVQEYVQGQLPPEEQQGQLANEYNLARGLNKIFARFREQKYPGMADLLAFRQEKWGNRYLTRADFAERDAFDAQHPELAAYRQWEAAYAQEHPVWAKYYRPWLLEEGAGTEAAAAGTEQAEGERAQRAGGRGGYGYYYGGGGSYSPIGSWADFAALTDVDTLTSLFGYWGQGTALSGAARANLEALHERYGWGDFGEWLKWLQRLYQSAFTYQARNVPNVRYPYWLPGMWS